LTSAPLPSGEPSPKFQVKVKGGVPFNALALNVTVFSSGMK
jgi:hypothetical protein